MRRIGAIVALGLALAACGGGGGGGGGSTGPSPGGNTSSGLSFAPRTAAATTYAGQSADISVSATVNNPDDFSGASAVYVKVIDTTGVITPDVQVVANSITSYTATLHVSTAAPAGHYQGNFLVRLCQNSDCTSEFRGSPVNLPFDIQLNAPVHNHKLLAANNGVALVSNPQWSRLTRTVSLKDSLGLATAWSAVSDQSWLSVTHSGTTTGGQSQLVLTADPTSLPSDQLSLATVTITSSDSSVSGAETIRVGLWNGSSAPPVLNEVLISAGGISVPTADPVRPYAYVASSRTQIDIYNVYSAQKLNTVVAPYNVDEMAISTDGKHLYAVDNTSADQHVMVMDLETQQFSGQWEQTSGSLMGRMKYARFNGRDVLLSADGKMAYEANSGKLLNGATGFSGFDFIEPAADGQYIFSAGAGPDATLGSLAVYLGRYSVDVPDVPDNLLTIKKINSVLLGNSVNWGFPLVSDMAVSADGAHLFAVGAEPTRCSQYVSTDLSTIGVLPGIDHVNNSQWVDVEVGSDGRVYCAPEYEDQANGVYNVWAYDPNGNFLQGFYISTYSSMDPHTLKVSGDGMMLIASVTHTGGRYLSFVTVGP